MTIKYQDYFFSARDGVRLFFRSWSVVRPKGVVAVIHGYAEHSGRYEKTAEFLCNGGWSVAAFDCRGHGQSGGRRAHIDDFSQYLNDVDVFLEQLKQHDWMDRCVLLGHSQGGLIASRYLESPRQQIAGLVLSSPFFEMALRVGAFKDWAGRLFSLVMPSLIFKNGIDSNWISHDRTVVDQYDADPLVTHVASVRWYTEVLSAQKAAIGDASNIHIPLLLLQAGDDRLVSVDASRRFFESAGSKNKVLKVYEGYYHEILNETGADMVCKDLLDWLEQHICALPKSERKI